MPPSLPPAKGKKAGIEAEAVKHMCNVFAHIRMQSRTHARIHTWLSVRRVKSNLAHPIKGACAETRCLRTLSTRAFHSKTFRM